MLVLNEGELDWQLGDLCMTRGGQKAAASPKCKGSEAGEIQKPRRLEDCG